MPIRKQRRGSEPAVASPAVLPIRVLLVEDNPGDARLILEMLGEVQRDTFDVERVDRLAPALERLSRAAVDVVLLDLGLPDSQGLETLERTRRGTSDEAIVVISGLDDEALAVEAVRAGAQDYVVKSRIEGQLLARVIRYAIERQRAETRLRWLTLAVEQSPASVFITDPHGTIEYVNARFTEITGYAANEAIGRKPSILKSGLTPPEHYQALWRTILAGETWRAEIQNRRRTGELYWDSVVISPIRDARGAVVHFLAVQADITERKTAEAARRASEEQSRLLLDSTAEGIYGLDVSGVCTFCNPAAARFLGYERPEHLHGKKVHALMHHTRADGTRYPPEECQIYQAFRRGDGTHVDTEVFWRADGSSFPVEYWSYPIRKGGVVVGAVVTFLDVTERKRAEEALRGSERRLRTLFETVNLIVLGLDADGNVEYVNPFFASLSGYTREEVVGKRWLEFLPQAHGPTMQGVFREQLEREFHPHYENPILTKAGEERMIAWNNTVLRDARGQPIGALSIGEDITERQGLERQLRQAQKMEAIGRLAGGVAHDFNNVLTAIFGYADLVMEDLPADSQSHRDLEEVRKAAQRASTLTRQLLAFSRQQVLAPVVMSLNELVEDIDKMLGRLIGEDVELRLQLAEDLGNVRVDPGQVQQVIMNLVVNARDAMPSGGRLLIETANADLTEEYGERRQPVIPGRYVMLAVSDTGVGMTPEVMGRIFEPFFTTKEKGKGTGLGLSTVYGIVKQSSGYVWVYSEPGRGTTFKVYLPRVDAPVDVLAPARETGTIVGTETILLAEDDESLRRLARGLLERLGYTVLEAPNAAQALALAASHAGPIHLLVSDVVMPGASGRELARRLAASRPDTKVLYMSGYTDDAIVHHGMLEPGLNFLQKPFTPSTLTRKVREVLDATKGES